ncbi:hypothetical protein TNCV_1337321 [Trichonephila clavipes]|nr:hypothetical protein TNCV_1337321 [Trichonephila clavipes]
MKLRHLGENTGDMPIHSNFGMKRNVNSSPILVKGDWRKIDAFQSLCINGTEKKGDGVNRRLDTPIFGLEGLGEKSHFSKDFLRSAPLRTMKPRFPWAKRKVYP